MRGARRSYALHGGSWRNHVLAARTVYRGAYVLSFRHDFLGSRFSRRWV